VILIFMFFVWTCKEITLSWQAERAPQAVSI